MEEFYAIIEWLEVERFKDESLIKKDEERSFDLNKDFSIYNVDFIRFYNINLKTEDIDYFTFKELLSGLFNFDSFISSVVKCRTYKPDNNDSDEYRKAMSRMGDTYRLE